MTKHLVATCTDRAEIIGEAETEADAVQIIRNWLDSIGDRTDVTKAKLADVMIDLPAPDQYRFPVAWIADLG